MTSSGSRESGTRAAPPGPLLPPSLSPPASLPGMIGVLAGVAALDQFTKQLVLRALAVGESVPVIDGWLWISHVRNRGAAFSLFRELGPLLAVAAAVGIVVLVFMMVRRPPRIIGYAAALVAAGALGNLTDRLLRGEVVDFVDFRGRYPAFNVADSAIAVGVVLLLIFSGRAARRADDEPAADDRG